MLTTFSADALLIAQTLLTEEEQSNFENIINSFIADNGEKIEEFFEYYLYDSNILTEPEALFILERLEADRFALRDAWQSILPLRVLQNLASAWGQPYRD